MDGGKKYKVLKIIGHARSGNVLLGRGANGLLVVMKPIIGYDGSEKILKKIENKIGCENFPCIVDIYSERTNKFLVTKYLENSLTLDDFRKFGKHLTLQKIQYIILTLSKQLCLLHKHNIVHGDIKPENIIVNKSLSKVYFIDYGNSCDQKKCNNVLGTPGYEAPEIILQRFSPNKNKQGLFLNEFKKADVFSLGIVLFRLLNKGKFPPPSYAGMKINDESKQLKQEYIAWKHYKVVVSNTKLLSALKRMLVFDSSKRISSNCLYKLLK